MPPPDADTAVIWKDLDSARQQAVRGIMEKYARLHDKADDDVLNLDKSTAADRYAKTGGRVAMDMAHQHEQAHMKIARDEYKELRVKWAELEGELESERRRIHQHAVERGQLEKRQYEENRRAR
jgi:hypothetical protein